MGVHHISWFTSVSGLEDEILVADALTWLIGDADAVSIEKTTSFHGSTMYLVTAELKNKGPATKSLSRLGNDALEQLISSIDKKLDEENVLHIRLDLLELLAGRVLVCEPSSRPSVKGITKLQVYPGNSPRDITLETLNSAKTLH